MPNILRAAGDARFTMTVSIVSMWAFRVGFCYLCVLAFHGGLLAIWMGMYLDWAFPLPVLLCTLRARQVAGTAGHLNLSSAFYKSLPRRQAHFLRNTHK